MVGEIFHTMDPKPLSPNYHIPLVGHYRIGIHPYSCFRPGVVAIVVRPRTLSYEVASTARAGIGGSLVTGMGVDSVPGTDYVDALN